MVCLAGGVGAGGCEDALQVCAKAHPSSQQTCVACLPPWRPAMLAHTSWQPLLTSVHAALNTPWSPLLLDMLDGIDRGLATAVGPWPQFGTFHDACYHQREDVARTLLVERHVQRATQAFQQRWEPEMVRPGIWGDRGDVM